MIGGRRWDWDNGRWLASETQPLHEPAYVWQGAQRARLLGGATVAGRRVRVIAAFRPDPDYPAWFRLFVSRDRVLRAEMLAPAHFMVDTFDAFNRPLTIEAPARGAR